MSELITPEISRRCLSYQPICNTGVKMFKIDWGKGIEMDKRLRQFGDTCGFSEHCQRFALHRNKLINKNWIWWTRGLYNNIKNNYIGPNHTLEKMLVVFKKGYTPYRRNLLCFSFRLKRKEPKIANCYIFQNDKMQQKFTLHNINVYMKFTEMYQ